MMKEMKLSHNNHPKRSKGNAILGAGNTSHMDREKLIPWKKQRVILFLAHDEVIEYIKLHLSNCFHF